MLNYRFPAALIAGALLLLQATALSAQTPPEQTLEAATRELFTVLERERQAVEESPPRLFELIDDTLGPHVDFTLISQLVLGRHWRTADQQQQQRFIEEFRLLLVRFYVSALLEDPRRLDVLLENGTSSIRFQPSQVDPGAERTIVRAEVHQQSGQIVPVTFNVHHRGPRWRIYDVNVGGISLVTNYRSSFATEIRQGGLDALIARLENHNQDLLERTAAR